MHVAGEEKSERERLVCVLEQPENTVRRQWDVARREAAKETKNKKPAAPSETTDQESSCTLDAVQEKQ